jgi:hypothetical protein
MREAARRALCEVGVLKDHEPFPPFTVRMSGNLSFLVYPAGSAFYLVKVGLQNDLRREFDGFSAGHAAFPHGVPRPLKLSRHRSFPTLVTTGIQLAPLGALSMRAPQRALRQSLAVFFATANLAFRVNVTVSHSQRIREALEDLPVIPRTSWERYFNSIATDVDHLPAVRQHGDFSVNNLGMHGDDLVVIDWEDYGRECLPGYDLALLLLALNEFSVARVRENTLDGAVHAWILKAGSEGTGIPPAMFIRLLPAYLALTLRMKTEMAYGHGLRSLVINALADSLHGDFAPAGGERS